MRTLTAGVVLNNEGMRHELRTSLRNYPVQFVLDQPAQLDPGHLKRLNPELLFLDGGVGWEPLEVLVRRVKSVCPSVVVTIVDQSPSTEAILAAMRAGADEFLFPPIEERLKPIIERASAQAMVRQYSPIAGGKVVAFASAKGGCGATTLACHVAAELQRSVREEVLLADFDLEHGIAGFLMRAKTSYSILDAIKNLHRLDSSFWKGLVANDRPRLDVIPAPAGLALHDPLRPEHFHSVFRLIRSIYSWVVADLGRNLNVISLALLEDLDDLFVVSGVNVPALYQSKTMVQRLLDIGFPKHRLHLVLNRMPRHSAITAREVSDFLGVPVYAVLPDRPELDEAYGEGTLVDRRSELGGHFARFAQKLAGAPQERPRSFFWFLAPRRTAEQYQGV